MRRLAVSTWRHWIALTPHIGNFQARLLLTLLYFTWFVPFVMLVRLLSDPLGVRGRRKPVATTAWQKRFAQKRDVQALRRQF
jgi:hypothetical protein